MYHAGTKKVRQEPQTVSILTLALPAGGTDAVAKYVSHYSPNKPAGQSNQRAKKAEKVDTLRLFHTNEWTMPRSDFSSLTYPLISSPQVPPFVQNTPLVSSQTSVAKCWQNSTYPKVAQAPPLLQNSPPSTRAALLQTLETKYSQYSPAVSMEVVSQSQ